MREKGTLIPSTLLIARGILRLWVLLLLVLTAIGIVSTIGILGVRLMGTVRAVLSIVPVMPDTWAPG